jgi:hypothetical protein
MIARASVSSTFSTAVHASRGRYASRAPRAVAVRAEKEGVDAVRTLCNL